MSYHIVKASWGRLQAYDYQMGLFSYYLPFVSPSRDNLLSLSLLRSITVTTILLCILLIGCAENKTLLKKKSQALENLGNSLVQQGDLRGGLEKLLEANKLEPDNPNIHNELGLVYRDLEAYPKSLFHFKKALTLKPKFSEARNNLGTLYLLLKEWDSALACFQKAVSNIFYKTPHYAYNNMGLAYHNKGNYQKAIESYHKALQSFPSYSLCYENLARSYEAVNQWELAIKAYEKSIYYAPNYPIPHLNLARLYLKLNRQDEAVKELTLTIEIDPKGFYGNEAKQLLQDIQ
jgi:type IV pilus assembly protein PilF